MRVLIILLVATARLLRFLSRLAKKGQGTAISGWIVEKKMPWIMAYYDTKYSQKVFITGTNGKTTTRAMLVSLLRQSAITTATNAGGANIYRGIAGSILLDTTLLGNPTSTILVLEVEEATAPRLVSYIKPTHIILTNIARDQLDLYGEVDSTANYIQTLVNRSVGAKIFFNQDDPQLKALSMSGYGVSAVDLALKYERADKVRAKIIETAKIYSNDSAFVFENQTLTLGFEPKITGSYNSINYGLALSCAFDLVKDKELLGEYASFITPVFARQETIITDHAETILILIKNPLGFEASLTTVGGDTALIIGINDNIADGKDVSWLWDVDFGDRKLPNKLYVAGSRALDMKLRLSQVLRSRNQTTDILVLTGDQCVQLILTSHNNLTVLGTYTFVTQLRTQLESSLDIPSIASQGY